MLLAPKIHVEGFDAKAVKAVHLLEELQEKILSHRIEISAYSVHLMRWFSTSANDERTKVGI